jgi:Eukaryotic aspartyl protease
MFSLKLSDSYHNITGDLRFSSTNTDLYIEPLITFPVSHVYETEPDSTAAFFLSAGWQVSMHSVSLVWPSGSTLSVSGPRKTSNFSLEGYVAAFSTTYPVISFTHEITERIYEAIGDDDMVDCDKRDILPSLVINLALGDDYVSFVLGPRDYIRHTPRFELEPHKGKCQVCIGEVYEDVSDVKYILLGGVFLARYYSVFDYDNETVSCKLHHVIFILKLTQPGV